MISLKANKREAGSSKTIDEVFGNIYGKGKENVHIIFKHSDFEKLYSEAGTSEVVEIDVDGEKIDVVIKDIQIDPRKDRIYHVDFYQFTKGEVMEVEVPLVFVGEPEVEKIGGVLNHALENISIEVLPKDMPKEIEVDLSVLKEIGDVVRVADLKIPASAKLLIDPELAVVSVVEAKEADSDENEEEGGSTEE